MLGTRGEHQQQFGIITQRLGRRRVQQQLANGFRSLAATRLTRAHDLEAMRLELGDHEGDIGALADAFTAFQRDEATSGRSLGGRRAGGVARRRRA